MKQKVKQDEEWVATERSDAAEQSLLREYYYHKDRKCPKCGTVMCEQSDERPGPNGITLCTPNGQFICYRCGEKAVKS